MVKRLTQIVEEVIFKNKWQKRIELNRTLLLKYRRFPARLKTRTFITTKTAPVRGDLYSLLTKNESRYRATRLAQTTLI